MSTSSTQSTVTSTPGDSTTTTQIGTPSATVTGSPTVTPTNNSLPGWIDYCTPTTCGLNMYCLSTTNATCICEYPTEYSAVTDQCIPTTPTCPTPNVCGTIQLARPFDYCYNTLNYEENIHAALLSAAGALVGDVQMAFVPAKDNVTVITITILPNVNKAVPTPQQLWNNLADAVLAHSSSGLLTNYPVSQPVQINPTSPVGGGGGGGGISWNFSYLLLLILLYPCLWLLYWLYRNRKPKGAVKESIMLDEIAAVEDSGKPLSMDVARKMLLDLREAFDHKEISEDVWQQRQKRILKALHAGQMSANEMNTENESEESKSISKYNTAGAEQSDSEHVSPASKRNFQLGYNYDSYTGDDDVPPPLALATPERHLRTLEPDGIHKMFVV